jgi:hypothetical protein
MFILTTNLICICYCYTVECSYLIAQQKIIMRTVHECIYCTFKYTAVCAVLNGSYACIAEKCFIRMKNFKQTHISAETECLIV